MRSGSPRIKQLAGIVGVALLAAGAMRHDEPLIAQDAAPVCTKNKAPILHKYCTTRHRPGGLGPFSLLDYAIAMENVADIKDA